MPSKSFVSHDSNARNSKKMLRMREKLGPIKDEEGYISDKDYEMLAFDFRCDTELIRTVVEDFGLFDISEDGGSFGSHGLEERMAIMELRSAAGKKGAQKRWENKNGNQMAQNGTNGVLPIAENDSANSTTDANKLKETKINKTKDIISSNELCPTEPSDAPEKTDDSEKILPDRHCQNVVDFWNRTVAETQSTLPQVLTLSDKRKKKMRIRWKEFSRVGDPVEVCRRVFTKACTSKFCQGDNKTGWSADFDWIFTNGENWVKVYEGNYDNKPQSAAKTQRGNDRIQNIIDEHNKFQQALHGFYNPISADSAPDYQGEQ